MIASLFGPKIDQVVENGPVHLWAIGQISDRFRGSAKVSRLIIFVTKSNPQITGSLENMLGNKSQATCRRKNATRSYCCETLFQLT